MGAQLMAVLHTATCASCGKEFQSVQRGRMYCDQSCYFDKRREPVNPTRDKVAVLRAAGKTLRVIADEVGLSSTRVAVLLKKGVPT